MEIEDSESEVDSESKKRLLEMEKEQFLQKMGIVKKSDHPKFPDRVSGGTVEVQATNDAKKDALMMQIAL